MGAHNGMSRKVAVGILVLFWLGGSLGAFFPMHAADTTQVKSTEQDETNDEEKDEKAADKEEKKEDKIDQLQEQIEDLEGEITVKRKKERTISEEIDIISQNVEAIKQQMGRSKQIISDLEGEIRGKDHQIGIQQKKIDAQKDVLGEYMRKINKSVQERQLIYLQNGGGIDEYFQLLDSYDQMQQEAAGVLEDIHIAKDQLEVEREDLDGKRSEQAQIVLMQEDQKRSLAYEESRKERLLKETQKDINILTVEKDELRTQLNALQSLGNPINLDDAIEMAKYASEKTGVRTAFLLGVLRVESNLGQNVGGGRYRSDMNPGQHDLFKKICKELDLDPSDMPVSRRVCYNPKSKDGCGGWGGAMGPAQFMPSTWAGYKDRVAKVTGHNPPNPWNLKDALVAMGLKLAAVSGVTDHKESAEKKAASMYLAGGNWQNYTWYGDRVLYYADGFERYMDD